MQPSVIMVLTFCTEPIKFRVTKHNGVTKCLFILKVLLFGVGRGVNNEFNSLYFLLRFSGRRVGAGGSTRYDRTPGGSGMTPMYGSRTPMYGSQTPLYGSGDGSRTPHYGSQTPSHEPGSMTPGRAGAWDPTVSNTPARYLNFEVINCLLREQ